LYLPGSRQPYIFKDRAAVCFCDKLWEPVWQSGYYCDERRLVKRSQQEHCQENCARTKEPKNTSMKNTSMMKNTTMKKMPKPRDVDDYIAAAPKDVQGKLEEFRAIIRKAAPTAEERISYGMPYYSYKGRLAYFSIWKAHLGLYIPTPVLEEHESELGAYETTGATVRFPLDKKLPVGLITKLLKARMKKNEQRKKK
jgi:uncharacterized protein YdhG (YjbR/CyaY superfamily)